MMQNSVSGHRCENSMKALIARLNPLTLINDPADRTRKIWLRLRLLEIGGARSAEETPVTGKR